MYANWTYGRATRFQYWSVMYGVGGGDVIADMIPYEDYEAAETILSLQQGGLGERGALFRDTPVAKQRTDQLRRAQAEASLQCR